jgi:hypothetical protein
MASKVATTVADDVANNLPTEDQGDVAVVSNRDSAYSSAAIDFRADTQMRPEGWGSKYVPPFARRSSRDVFFRIVDQIVELVDRLILDANDRVLDEQQNLIAEIESLLEQLYECEWGEGESLKKIVVEVQSQVLQTQWDRRHVLLVARTSKTMRARYLIDDKLVAECHSWVEEVGLDPLRGIFA